MRKRKTISLVIATIILLLVSIVSATYLFDFIIQKQAEFYTDFEEKQNSFLSVPEVRDIYNKKLHIYSKGTTNYDSISINDVECDVNRSKILNNGLNKINVNDCLFIEDLPKRVKIKLDYGGRIIEKSDFIKENALTSLIKYLSCDSGVYTYNSIKFNLVSKLGHNSKKSLAGNELISNGNRSYSATLSCNNANISFSNFNLKVNCDKKFDLDSSNVCVSYCYNSLNVGKVGTFGVCTDMLIVDRNMLIGEDSITIGIDKKIEHNGVDYTFGDSPHNIFTGQITDMSQLFFKDKKFNSDINYWDVSNVINMRKMFHNANSFNQPLNNWDVSSVTDMMLMFHNANSFNQDLRCWNVTKISSKPSSFAINSPLNTNGMEPIWGTSGSCKNGFYFSFFYKKLFK